MTWRWALVGLSLFFVSSTSQGQMRTWTDHTGKYRTEAEMVDAQDGMVRLKKSDGSVVTVPLTKLSEADQEFVHRQTSHDESTGIEASGEHLAGPPIDVLAPSATPVVIELATGAQLAGRIRDRTDDRITMDVMVQGRTFTRTLSTSSVRSVTIDGKRHTVGAATSDGATTVPSRSTTDGQSLRTRREIELLIEQQGRTPPDWWDSTPVEYPPTLDLSWPIKPEGPWNAQKNVGQYLWDIIYPNQGKWRSGVRLVHFLLERHKNDRTLRQRDMKTLGGMYFLLFQDYPRAAFWWRMAGVDKDRPTPARDRLAECYFRMGNKQMAMELLQSGNTFFYSSIKLLGDMGETQRALQLAESAARSGWADLAYLHAGDVCRREGRYKEAIEYYEKALAVPAEGKQKQRIERNHQRARANIAAVRVVDLLDLNQIPDGRFEAKSPGYAGDVHVAVTVHSGRIESVEVVSHKERQYYAALIDTPRQIVATQGVKNIDATTGATITSEAIINATAQALAAQMK